MTTQTTETRNAVAVEILKQLGGSRFIAMTGSKNFVSGSSTLTMKLAKNKSDAGYLKIHLTSFDLYDMSFFKVNTRDYLPFVVTEVSNVYAEDLQSIFTDITGLYTRL